MQHQPGEAPVWGHRSIYENPVRTRRSPRRIRIPLLFSHLRTYTSIAYTDSCGHQAAAEGPWRLFECWGPGGSPW